MKKNFNNLILMLTVALLMSLLASCSFIDNLGKLNHTHDYSLLKYDSVNHWYECLCGDKSYIENHSGGVATELDKAICLVCNQAYGDTIIHSHKFNKETPNKEYLHCDATCESKALYYYSCVCGEKGQNTFEYGNPLGHNYGVWASNGDGTHSKTCANDNSHKITENCSGGIATEKERPICVDCNQSYGEVLPHKHVFNNALTSKEFLKINATCQTSAEYFYSCACGEHGEASFYYGGVVDCLFLDYVSNNDATYRNDGTKTSQCSYGCGKTNTMIDWNSKIKVDIPEGEIYVRVDDYVFFGSFPQTIKSKDVTIEGGRDENGYYLGSDGEKYALGWTVYETNRKTFTDGTKLVEGEKYYFKVEPIRWKIIKEGNGVITLLCDSIINAKNFSSGDNNYANSYIRSYLNNFFLNNSFSQAQQEVIMVSTVDNSKSSTDSKDPSYSYNPYACENTKDKVYLLSYREKYNLINSGYNVEDFPLICSDYAIVNGADTDNMCWLRSPTFYNKNMAQTFYYAGAECSDSRIGIAPVIQMHLGCNYIKRSTNDRLVSPATCQQKAVYLAKCVCGKSETYEYGEYAKHNYQNNLCVWCGAEFFTEGLEFSLLNNNSAYSVIDYNGNTDSVYIPSEYLGKPVTNIGDKSFSHCYYISQIRIPETVISIGDQSFTSCSSLKSITIPRNVVSLGANLFEFCSNLMEINVYNSDYYISIDGDLYSKDAKTLVYYAIGKRATKFTVPSAVTAIGDYAFRSCNALKEITLSNNLISIGKAAFSICNIETLTIPKSVTTIGESAFSSNNFLVSVIFEDGIQLKTISAEMFMGCETLKNIKLPNSITRIDESAFTGCEELNVIVIPLSVKYVDHAVFFACVNLTIYCEQSTVSYHWSPSWNSSGLPKFYYSEYEPTLEGNYWHYVDGVPTKW